MRSQVELRNRAEATYNAAADCYDASENWFWDRFGRRTVERLNLRPGMRVLDVCSGCGASAIPAAEAVGDGGSVVTVDLAADLLAHLEAKAKRRGLHQLSIHRGDFLDMNLSGAQFDAVICVFGIFFVADMPAAVNHLWRCVAPGGTLAITTWGPRLFEPANGQFWNAVRDECPDLYKQFNPWDTITTPEALRQLLASGGVLTADIVAEAGFHPLATPSSWWALVMGSGYRGTVEQLTPEARERVRAQNLRDLASAHVTEVEANVIYAVSRKPVEL
jgi:ubiquinone/menaquinone biosynthesis C-methylase UbiE